MPRYKALIAAWRVTPPLPRLIASVLTASAAEAKPRGDFATFVQAMTGGHPPD